MKTGCWRLRRLRRPRGAVRTAACKLGTRWKLSTTKYAKMQRVVNIFEIQFKRFEYFNLNSIKCQSSFCGWWDAAAPHYPQKLDLPFPFFGTSGQNYVDYYPSASSPIFSPPSGATLSGGWFLSPEQWPFSKSSLIIAPSISKIRLFTF